MRRILIARTLLALLLLAAGTHLAMFLRGELVAAPRALAPARVAVVFTGAYARIDAGLDMLARGEIEQLFISGANPNAGIWLDRFNTQFGRGRADLARLIACCVSFGKIADTTMENAAETACWLDARNVREPIALVTSWDHMPRAHAALAGVIGAARIVPAPVGAAESAQDARGLALEYMKYWGTRAVAWAPSSLFPARHGPFRAGCLHAGDK